MMFMVVVSVGLETLERLGTHSHAGAWERGHEGKLGQRKS